MSPENDKLIRRNEDDMAEVLDGTVLTEAIMWVDWMDKSWPEQQTTHYYKVCRLLKALLEEGWITT